MRIICTVEEFGKLVRGCAKNECYSCPMRGVCETSVGDGIERFISANDVVEEENESEEA